MPISCSSIGGKKWAVVVGQLPTQFSAASLLRMDHEHSRRCLRVLQQIFSEMTLYVIFCENVSLCDVPDSRGDIFSITNPTSLD